MLEKFRHGAGLIKNTFLAGTQKIGEQLSVLADGAVEVEEERGPNWEPSDNVEFCRGCRAKFQIALWKHHCRPCGGVFCENCCVPSEVVSSAPAAVLPPSKRANGPARSSFGTSVATSSSSSSSLAIVRVCYGCLRGEAAGENICNIVEEVIKTTRPDLSVVDLVQRKVVTKMGEIGSPVKSFVKKIVQGDEEDKFFPPSEALMLVRGSRYGEDGLPVPARLAAALPNSGYFEMLNKSSSFCCVKVLIPGGDPIWEVPRPSYIAVPPGEIVHTLFDPELPAIQLLILYDNPFPVRSDIPIVYDTATPNITPASISPCALISNFREAVVIEIASRRRNVLLKYKGGQQCEARKGSAISRVGIFGWLQGVRFARDRLDFDTNVERLRRVFSTEQHQIYLSSTVQGDISLTY